MSEPIHPAATSPQPSPGFFALCAVLRERLHGMTVQDAASQVGLALGVVTSELMDESQLQKNRQICRDCLVEGFDAAF